jgi:drug/metabolite transporter (DMT)-like permease
VLSRRFQFKTDTFVATGWQIGAAAVFNWTVAAVTGSIHRAQWSWRGFGAIVYLSIFGSLIGLVAFTYLLKNVRVTKVSTYAFVNPVIAVLLGFLVLHERLNASELMGMAVIVCAVAMVIYSRVGNIKAEQLPAELAGNAGEAVE